VEQRDQLAAVIKKRFEAHNAKAGG